jgi:phage-related protein
MAINLGSAFVTVNAVTSNFSNQLKRGLSSAGKDADGAGERVGRNFSRSFTRGFGGGGRTIFTPQFFREADQARERFNSLLRTGYVLGPLITALAGIIGALGAALFVVGAAAGVAAQALIVLPASLLALAQAAVVAKVAMIGVGEAIKAGLKPASGGAKDTTALKNALERLEDARIRLARATESAAEKIESANRRVFDAEEDYIEAQYESEKAAQKLSRARREAAEDLKQLRFETEGAAISEQRARLQFERSRESLQRVQDLPPNSRARREAELAFAEADLNLRKSIDRNATLKQTEKEATAAGVDGSEKVLDASEALAKAKKREADAYRGIQDAVIAAARAQRDANRQIEDAERALARAKEDVANASKKASGGVDQFAEAMKKLSPEAQEFVRYIISIKDEFKELRAAAGQELFPRLIVAIDNLVKNLLPKLVPLFRETGKVLGEAATSLSDTITEGRNLERLERVWKTNDKLIGNFSGAINNLYEVFLVLLDAADTTILRFGKWIETVTEGWKQTLNAEGATEKLRKRFERAADVFARIGKILGNFFKGLGGLTAAINKPGGAIDLLLDKLEAASLKFREFATADENAEGINTFFVGVVTNAGKVLSIIGELFKAFGRIGASEDLGGFLDNIKEAVTRLGDAADKFTEGGGLTVFGEFLNEFARTIANFTESGSINVFFGILRDILGGLNEFLETKFGQKLVTEVAPVLAVFSTLGFVFKIVRFFFQAFIGALGSAFKVLRFFFPQLATLSFFISAPFLVATAIIAGFILLFVGLYNSSEEFRVALKDLWEFLKGAFLDAWGEIKEALQDAFGDVSNLKETFKNMGDFIARYVIPVLRGTLKFAIQGVTGVIKGLIYFIRGIIDAFDFVVNALAGIYYFINGDTEKAVEKFKKAWESLLSFFNNLGKGIYEIFRGILNGIIGFINEIIKAINKVNPKINIKLIQELPSASDIVKPTSTFTYGSGNAPEFTAAKGGIFYPSNGGTLVRVAEAGKPERIEPLDSSGLSKRDRAIIEVLANQSGVGPTINVYPSQGMDERELAEMVSRKLAFQMRRGGI